MRGRRARRSCLTVWCRGSLGKVALGLGGKGREGREGETSYTSYVSSCVGRVLAVVDLGVGRRRRRCWRGRPLQRFMACLFASS